MGNLFFCYYYCVFVSSDAGCRLYEERGSALRVLPTVGFSSVNMSFSRVLSQTPQGPTYSSAAKGCCGDAHGLGHTCSLSIQVL